MVKNTKSQGSIVLMHSMTIIPMNSGCAKANKAVTTSTNRIASITDLMCFFIISSSTAR